MAAVLRVVLRNQMPEVLLDSAPNVAFLAAADQYAAHERDRSVWLERDWPEDLQLPRIGDEVIANPNFEAVHVERVVWRLGGEPVVIELADLDEDEVGEDLALGLLLHDGWRTVES